MNVTFVIYSMQSGGAERVLSVMANHWAEKSHKITIITLVDDKSNSFYDIDPRVNQVSLGVAGASQNWFSSILNNFHRIYKLRRAIHKAMPDAIISFLTETNVLTLMATIGSNAPVLVTEHTDPWVYPIAAIWGKLRLWLYPRACRVVVLSEWSSKYFSSSPSIKVVTIPNPVVVDRHNVKEIITQDIDRNHLIIAMGRLAKEKRFDLLLLAYSVVARIHPDWKLLILGEGHDRKGLEALRDELGLENRVFMPGTVKAPHAVLKKGKIFVLSSDYEAFPMALCEAMACGLPVIATEYSSAVHDIIQDGQNGVLVPPGDSMLLADAIMHLINHPHERNQLAGKSVEIGERFSLDSVMAIWEELLEGVVAAPYQ